MNSEELNGAELNGGVFVVGAPIGVTFFAEVIAKTDFISFTNFGTPPLSLAAATVPVNTDMRFGFRFSPGGTIKTFTGVDWQDLVGDPIVNGMTVAGVGGLAAPNMTATGGFVATTNFFQIIVYLKTVDLLVAPSLSGITITYQQGSTTEVIWANTFSSPVPVAGASALPAGTYIWDTINGYRLEDGTTDFGLVPITKNFRTHKHSLGINAKGFYRSIEIEIDSTETTTINVMPIIDGINGTIITMTVNIGTFIYKVGIPNAAPGVAVQAELTWLSNLLIVRDISFVSEVSGESQP